MSLASREALNKLINRAEVAQFATHAEDWSTCSTTDLLTAAADELGKLAEREAYVNNTGTARAEWTARRSDLQRCLILARFFFFFNMNL